MNGRDLRDASLSLPSLPSLSRGVGSPSFPLERSPHLEQDPPFHLRAAGVRVDGGHGRGVDVVRGDRSPVALALAMAVDGAIAERSTLSPLGLERRLKVGGVEVVERVVTAPAGPVVFMEWTASHGVGIDIRWRVPIQDARWHASEGGLVVSSPAVRRLTVLSRPAKDLVIRGRDGDELRVTARFVLESGEGVVIAMAEATDATDARVLRVMGRPHVVVPARRAAALRTLQSTLSLEAPGTPVSDALDWARLSLASETVEDRAIGPGRRLSERSLRIALAGLAIGDPSVARSLILAAAVGPAVNATGARDEERSAADARWLLLIARYLAWTGDRVLMKEQWERVRSRAGPIMRAGPESARLSRDLRRRALEELAVAAEDVGDRALARRAREAVGDETPAPAVRWEPVVPGGLGGIPGGADIALESAAVIEDLVEGVLGAEPDAPRGRLVLRPRLPVTWSTCVIRGLSMGEVVVEVAYRTEAGSHRWAVRQRRGGAPITLIFEPEMPGVRLAGARVDGVEAELDVVVVEGRVRVSVQLVLDHERAVEVEIEGPDD